MTSLGSKYELDEVIGRGAYGMVYRAHDHHGAVYAVKVLRPDITSDSNVVSRFVQERSISMQFADPRLVRVIDFVVEGETLAIVMELVAGPALRSYLTQSGTLPPGEALDLSMQVLDALAVVHAAGVVHRDIKPANALLDRPGPGAQAKITDFGISWLHGAAHLTASSNVLGTPAYTSPEAASGDELESRSDVYAVGIMLYEMLFGVTPFVGGGVLAVLNRHVTHEPGRPDGVPDELWQAISSLTSKDPAARPTAAQARTDLAALRPAAEAWPRFRALESPPPPVPLLGEAPTGTARTIRSRPSGRNRGGASGRGRRRLWAAAAGVFVLAGAGAAWAISGTPTHKAADPRPSNSSAGRVSTHSGAPASERASTGATRTVPSGRATARAAQPKPTVVTSIVNGVPVLATVTPGATSHPAATSRAGGPTAAGPAPTSHAGQASAPPPVAPTINTVSLPDGITGRNYSAKLSAKGVTPFSWAKISGNLLSGLTLSTDGAITGTIGSTGTVTFTVKVTDGNGLSASRTLSLTSTHLQADINYDGQVNCYELDLLKANYNKSPATYQEGDVNQDGIINALDLSLVSSEWTGPPSC